MRFARDEPRARFVDAHSFALGEQFFGFAVKRKSLTGLPYFALCGMMAG
jgi:hypothetical protein